MTGHGIMSPSTGETDMTAQAKALHTEARKLTKEMFSLEQSGANEDRLTVVYARLVEIEKALWS